MTNDTAMLLVATFGFIGMAWGIIASILNHKSIPVSEIDKFLLRASEMALKSESKLDDSVVNLANTAWQGAKDMGLLTPKAPEVVAEKKEEVAQD